MRVDCSGDCVDVSTVCRWGKPGRADSCDKR